MRKDDGMVQITSEDTHCFIRCVCEEEWDAKKFSIGNHCITRCPKCNRGYRTEFLVWVYSPEENDPVYLNGDEWDREAEKSRKEYNKEFGHES